MELAVRAVRMGMQWWRPTAASSLDDQRFGGPAVEKLAAGARCRQRERPAPRQGRAGRSRRRPRGRHPLRGVRRAGRHAVQRGGRPRVDAPRPPSSAGRTRRPTAWRASLPASATSSARDSEDPGAVAAMPAAGVAHPDRRLHQLMAADLDRTLLFRAQRRVGAGARGSRRTLAHRE
ncbi:unnamed protein product [Miscanthus lutarioriparius]|uniref:Uncharacterized protein n=1 Tax=Miscanthus lutarioriparius TaxID=422564 RepID=A0A811NM44_9POAL|nr:unnamed protein product [Miscanthus lutarioriparius]